MQKYGPMQYNTPSQDDILGQDNGSAQTTEKYIFSPMGGKSAITIETIPLIPTHPQVRTLEQKNAGYFFVTNRVRSKSIFIFINMRLLLTYTVLVGI